MTAPPFKPVASRLDEKSVLVPFCGCKIWTGASLPFGYGVISVNGKQTSTHRAAWQEAFGKIPDGLLVLHSCDVPSCINPNHLFLGSAHDNTQDMLSKSRGNYSNRKTGADHHMSAGGYKGEQHPRRKLSQMNVDAIRSEYAKGATQVSLAMKFGVGQAQISSITRRESWV